MSVITFFKMENKVSYLENNIKKLKLLDDGFTFRIIINDSLKLLLSISKLIENKNDLFGKKIPKELLINIISFLSYKYIKICRNVCMSWLKITKSDFSKKILLSVPTNMCLSESIKLNFVPINMFKIKNYIYVKDSQHIIKFDIKTCKLTEEKNIFYKDVIYSNNKYICTKDPNNIYIYSLDIKLISRIPIKNTRNLTINNDKILISTDIRFYIYNINGNLIKTWDISNFRKFVSNSNEIFVAVNREYIKVFSYKGEFIRSWGKWGSKPGEFKTPLGITIHKNIVLVIDAGNNRFQGFTRSGKFIFEHKLGPFQIPKDIIIANGYIYVNDINNFKIIKLKLTYSYFND